MEQKFGLRTPTCGALFAALALAAAAIATAQPARHGPQFQVNTYTTGLQSDPVVASGAAGAFVVVWRSRQADADDSYESVQARRYGADGQPAGLPFQVNTATTGSQFQPAVALAPGGGFVVAFASYAGTESDTDESAVLARRFDAAGAPAGAEFQVNAQTSGSQRYPRVAFDAPTGSFAVVWYDSYDESIQARTYDASGEATGPPFPLTEEATDTKSDTSLAAVGGGEFVVAWEEFHPADELDWGVRAARFDSSGAVVVPPFSVNTFTTGNQGLPSVASDGAGRFVIAWWSLGSDGGDTDGASIHARLFDSAGVPGEAFQINTYTTGNQSNPAVAMDPRGHFVVAWESPGSSGTDSSSASIQARLFDESGAPAGDELQVNGYTTGTQGAPAIATDASGNFVVSWYSYGSAGTDVSDESIQAQRFDDLFRDDFEPGDWARWSATVP